MISLQVARVAVPADCSTRRSEVLSSDTAFRRPPAKKCSDVGADPGRIISRHALPIGTPLGPYEIQSAIVPAEWARSIANRDTKGGHMTRTFALTLGLVLIGFAGAQPAYNASGQAGGLTTLFDGKSLKGWNIVGDANWEVVDGVVQATKGTGFLVTPVSYGDFQITLEFWVTDDANSGVFIRCEDPKTINAMNAYEVNIYDKRPDQTYRTGGIVDVAKPASIINTGGQWNTYDITARGPRLMVTLNGMKMVDVEHKGHTRGPIALQYGAGTVKFRNVRIRTL